MMRNFMEDILYDRRGGLVSLPLRAALRSGSHLYGAGVRLRGSLYARGWLKTSSVSCKTVSIGNITLGGTGKTPLVIMTARALAHAGYRAAVVSRGYLRDDDRAAVVSDGRNILVSSREAGDEPHLVASSLPGIPVVVGRKRPEAARMAWERFRPEVIILDDAFQHLQLRRDVDIVALDAHSPFGNGMLLPRGILREPPCGLARAKAAILTRFEGEPPSRELENAIKRFNPEIEVFYSRHIPRAVRRFSDGTASDPRCIKGKKIAALSNIANPGSFHRMLESLGGEIVWKYIRPDHYRYRPGEPEDIVRQAAGRGAEMVIMTAKDERNLPDGCNLEKAEAAILEIEAVLIYGHDRYVKLVSPIQQ